MGNMPSAPPQLSEEEERSVPAVRRHQEDAVALANFALEMLKEISKVEVPNDRCAPLNMRIGLHVGRVVAGGQGTPDGHRHTDCRHKHEAAKAPAGLGRRDGDSAGRHDGRSRGQGSGSDADGPGGPAQPQGSGSFPGRGSVVSGSGLWVG